MNERIQELAWAAEDYAESIVDQGGGFHQAYTRKFAELIVKECMNRVRSRQQFAGEDQQNVTQAFDLLVYDLESHFGVEE